MCLRLQCYWYSDMMHACSNHSCSGASSHISLSVKPRSDSSHHDQCHCKTSSNIHVAAGWVTLPTQSTGYCKPFDMHVAYAASRQRPNQPLCLPTTAARLHKRLISSRAHKLKSNAVVPLKTKHLGHLASGLRLEQ